MRFDETFVQRWLEEAVSRLEEASHSVPRFEEASHSVPNWLGASFLGSLWLPQSPRPRPPPGAFHRRVLAGDVAAAGDPKLSKDIAGLRIGDKEKGRQERPTWSLVLKFEMECRKWSMRELGQRG